MEFLNIIIGLFLFLAFIRLAFSVFVVNNQKNLPPGPTPLPIIGNLHLLGDQPHQSLAKLANIHGPVMTLKLGHVTTLVVSSAAAAREVLQKQDLAFSSRYIPDAVRAYNHSQLSMVWLPVGSQWRTLRRILNNNIFSIKSLDSNQHLRTQKVQELIAYCKKCSQSNETVDIGRGAFRTSMNLISNTIMSKNINNQNEDSDKEFKKVVGDIMVEVGKPNLVDFFPMLKMVDPQRVKKKMSRHFEKVFEIFDGLIKERSRMTGLKHDDLLDVCLKITQENPHELNMAHIKSLFLDLFNAGTDTTSNTTEWAMTEMLRNPHIMAKAKEELEEVIGKGKIVNEDDVLSLPYLSCIVKETLRMHPPAPLLIPRKLETQANLNGYTIPKGTRVLVNAWAIGREPKSWEDPLDFKPERFLTSKIDVRGQDFELIPFGAGRRICPGLSLAIRMIPMMLGSLVNNFDWKIGNGELDMAEKFGITLQKSVPLCVVPIALD